MELPRIPDDINIKRFSHSRLGYVLAVSAAALSGLIHSVSKPLLTPTDSTMIEINPLTLAVIIYIINGLFFTPIKKTKSTNNKIGKKNLVVLGIIGIAEAAALILYFFGLKESTAVNASILTNSEIIFTTLIAFTIFQERLKKMELGPFSMIIAGIVLLPLGYDLYNSGFVFTNLVFGNLLIIFSGAFYALDYNLCKYVSNKIDAKRITQLASFASGGFALCLIFIFQIPFEVNVSQLPRIIVIGLFGTGVATFFFINSLRLIGAIRTVLIFSSTTVFGIFFANIFLQETVSIQNILSMILVFSGIYLLRNRLGKSKTIDESIDTESKKN